MGVIRPVVHSNPAVSVIVPTIPHRSHQDVVERLMSQRGVDYEVIIIEDETIGVCEARNRGLEIAFGEIVAFTDDDCLPQQTWLQNIVSVFKDNPDLVILEGRTGGGMDYTGKRKYPTCNVAVDRDTAVEIGGFRKEFEYWREDTEFGWRMEEVGEYMYSPDVKVYHPPETGSSFKEENEALLREEFPERYEDILIPDTVTGKINNWLWRKGFFDKIKRIKL